MIPIQDALRTYFVDSRRWILHASILASIVLKMIGLEKINIGSFPLEVHIVAALLPLAMVFRRLGVASMTIGCASAHLFALAPPIEIVAAASSAFIGSYLSYRLVKNSLTARRMLAGCLMITLVWSFIMSGEWTLTSQWPWTLTFALMLSRLFFAINFLGLILAIGVRRILDTAITSSHITPKFIK